MEKQLVYISYEALKGFCRLIPMQNDPSVVWSRASLHNLFARIVPGIYALSFSPSELWLELLASCHFLVNSS